MPVLPVVCALALCGCAAFLARIWRQGHRGDAIRVLLALGVLIAASATRHGFWSAADAVALCPAIVFGGRRG